MMQINDIFGKIFNITDLLDNEEAMLIPFLGGKLEPVLEPLREIIPDKILDKELLDLEFDLDFDEIKDNIVDKISNIGNLDAASATLSDLGLDFDKFPLDIAQFKMNPFEKALPVMDILEDKNLFDTESLEQFALTAQRNVMDLFNTGRIQLKEQVNELASNIKGLTSEFDLDVAAFLNLENLNINIPFLKERIEKDECPVGDFLVDIIGYKTQVVGEIAEEYANVASSMEELVLDIGASLENILPTELIPNSAVVQRIRSLEIAKLSFVANKALDFLAAFDESTTMVIDTKFQVLDDICEAFQTQFEVSSCEQVISAMRLSADEVHALNIAKITDKVTALDLLITDYINLLERQ